MGPLSRQAAPAPSSEGARQRMERQRRRDTGPEILLRRELHRLGLRYRVDVEPLPGLRRRADVVFPRARVAVYVDGCFWHSCPLHATQPKANSTWWASKLAANQRRDIDTDAHLAAAGWTVLRFWEHEDATVAANEIARVVRSRAGERRGATS